MTDPLVNRPSVPASPPSTTDIPAHLPILPLSDVVVFPHMVAPLLVSSPDSIRLIDDVVAGDRLVGVTLQKNPDDEHPRGDQLQSVGCMARVNRMLKFPDDSVRILIQGLKRMRISEYVSEKPYLVANITPLEDEVRGGLELTAFARNVRAQFQEIVSLTPNLPEELKVTVLNIDDPSRLADVIAGNLNLPLADKQTLLELTDVRHRLSQLSTFLNRELEVLHLGTEIQSKVTSALNKSQREYLLREQLKQIQKELGEGPEGSGELQELRAKIEAASLPADARKVALRELDRLAGIPTASAEYTVARTYLDWLVALPWSRATEDRLDIARARRILNEDHYDLEPVKKRILEYLSVLKLKSQTHPHAAGKAPILCFVGPPGVGKTSLGMSIARSLGRKFHRISLGGIRDEAEIRGHRRTYIGALPGRIIQGLRRVESHNPVFMLDEIDKLGADFRGDPGAALLEVLDPQQNATFSDHYLELPFDLSRVMFITTANQLDPIPAALRDRLEVIELPGYSEEDKVHIAQRFLIPRQLREHGLTSAQLRIAPDALRRIIRDYTREAGVRNLERHLATLCRRTARRIVEGRARLLRVHTGNLTDLLGPPEIFHEAVERTLEPGVAIGLAWTSVGGDILFVEATQMPGKGQLILTGSLGEVMKESVQAALSYVRAHAKELGIESRLFDKHDFHIHVPAGAIPKDGPSAGITMAVALASLLSGRRVRPSLAMSGEITLRGKILPVGGVKEKILAASRSGVRTILLPESNRRNLREIPAAVRKRLKFVWVRTIADAWRAALQGPSRTRQ